MELLTVSYLVCRFIQQTYPKEEIFEYEKYFIAGLHRRDQTRDNILILNQSFNSINEINTPNGTLVSHSTYFLTVFNKNCDQNNKKILDKCLAVKIAPGMRYDTYYHGPRYLITHFKHGNINYSVSEEERNRVVNSPYHEMTEVDCRIQQNRELCNEMNNFITSFYKKESDFLSEDNINQIWTLGIKEWIDNGLVIDNTKGDNKLSYINNYLLFGWMAVDKKINVSLIEKFKSEGISPIDEFIRQNLKDDELSRFSRITDPYKRLFNLVFYKSMVMDINFKNDS